MGALDMSCLFVFGGNYFGSHGRDIFLDTVSLLDTSCSSVEELPCLQGNPLAVGHHSFLKLNMGGSSQFFFVFGGEDGKQRFNNIYVLSLIEKDEESERRRDADSSKV